MGSEVIKTKFGRATIDDKGYYRISSKKEGNHGKFLHRLIVEDFYNTVLSKDWVVHHDDRDKTNNEIWNLIPMPKGEHSILHHKNVPLSEEHKSKISKGNKGKIISEETKKKISEANKGKVRTKESKIKMSLNHADYSGENNPMFGVKHTFNKMEEMSRDRNTSGYFRVNKHKSKEVKQGFMWRYQWYDDAGKRYAIASVDMKKLEEKVKARNLPWMKL